jgi:hypothetical protein
MLVSPFSVYLTLGGRIVAEMLNNIGFFTYIIIFILIGYYVVFGDK